MFTIVTKKPNEAAVRKDYENRQDFDYEEIQRIIGGYFQAVRVSFAGKTFNVYCDEDGKYSGAEPNILLVVDGKVHDIIYGPVIVVSNSIDRNGNEKSLTETEAIVAMKAMDFLDVNRTEQSQAFVESVR